MIDLKYPTIRSTHDESHGRPVFEIIEDFSLILDIGTFGELAAYIPRGSRTDFASVPRWLWWLVNALDHEVVVGALIHDSLYPTRFSRVNADNILRFIMVAYGASWWKHVKVYYAVRIFGWMFWPSRGLIAKDVLATDRV